MNGEQAYVAVDSVASFSTEGGQAVFEPGSAYEEVFTYARADAELNRLVGLGRSTPIAHSAGVFVGVAEDEAATATSEPTTPDETPSEEPAGSTGEAQTGGEDPASSDSSGSVDSSGPDPCELVFGSTCLEAVTDIVGENPCDRDGTGRTCDELVDEITNDPCGALVDNTCLGWILDVVGENPCDQLIQELADDPCGGLVGAPCLNWVEGVVASLQTMLCGEMDVDECTDEGVIALPDLWDTVDPAADELLAVDCVASAYGPFRDDDGPTAGVVVRGSGAVHCASNSHPDVSVKVCLDKKVAGVWQKLVCKTGHAAPILTDPHEAEAEVAQGCAKSGKFRVRARGQATTESGKVLDSDSDKSVAWVNCENVLD